jgi:hypothetical protein
MALPPPAKPKGGDKASRTLSKVVELSVFDVLNIFRRRWFLSRTALLTHVISAQKAEDGNISWVEFDPPFHSHLVTDLQGPPSERTQSDKIRDLKSLAKQYARDRGSCDDTRISYLEYVESEAEADWTLARMIAG